MTGIELIRELALECGLTNFEKFNNFPKYGNLAVLGRSGRVFVHIADSHLVMVRYHGPKKTEVDAPLRCTIYNSESIDRIREAFESIRG